MLIYLSIDYFFMLDAIPAISLNRRHPAAYVELIGDNFYHSYIIIYLN